MWTSNQLKVAELHQESPAIAIKLYLIIDNQFESCRKNYLGMELISKKKTRARIPRINNDISPSSRKPERQTLKMVRDSQRCIHWSNIFLKIRFIDYTSARWRKHNYPNNKGKIFLSSWYAKNILEFLRAGQIFQKDFSCRQVI